MNKPKKLEFHTEMLEIAYGPEKSKELHLHFKPGEVAYYPEGKTDNTHYSLLGATEVSKLVATQIRLLESPLCENLKKVIKIDDITTGSKK
ncbi:MAG: hypothetical protein C0512_15375 [Flavobacterium sp.]|nr:hypothetical protein [Flavobacterium sp. 102]MBA4155713.1 hypothetical protein [Flavobacterium sp.]